MDDCGHVERLLARDADGGGPLNPGERAVLDAHLASCAACRAAAAEQRGVSALLRAREPFAPAPGFAARVSARLDRDASESFLDVANWRTWTAGLAPVAAVLALAAYLGVGSAANGDAQADTTQASFDSWVTSGAAGTPASVFLQPSAGPDTLIETVLTGSVPAASGGDDVR